MAAADQELLAISMEAGSSPDDVDGVPAPPPISKKKILLSVIGVASAVAVGICALKPLMMQNTMSLDIESKALSSDSKNSILKMHNAYRCKHKVPALKWNEKIATNAQNWAQKVQGKMQHSSHDLRKNVGGFSYLGENLAWGDGVVGDKGVTMWYDEIDDTDGGLVSDFKSGTGHYTQVVWAGTTDLGCGSYGKLLVCQYGPGGNMVGSFSENVKKPVKAAAECGAPQKAANLGSYLSSLQGSKVECDPACKADGKGASFGYSWSSGGGLTTTTCNCKGGKLAITCKDSKCARV